MRYWQSVHLHTVDDKVQYIEHKEKKRRKDVLHTGCWWNRNCLISKSLESPDSVQQKRREPRDPGRHPEDTCGKYRTSSVLPDRFLSLIGSGLVLYTCRFGLGRDRSCPIATASRKYSFLLYFHSIQSITKFLIINPSRWWWILSLERLHVPTIFRRARCCLRSCCYPPQKKRHFSVYFDLLFDFSFAWCWPLRRRSVSLHWRNSLVGFESFFWLSHHFLIFLLQSTSNRFQVESIFHCLLLCWSMTFWVGCCFQLGFRSQFLQVGEIRWCRLPIFSLVFQLLCWSCIWSWVQGSILQLSLTISHSVRCFSKRQSPFHFWWVLFQHRIFAFSIFSMASSVLFCKKKVNPIFFFNHCCVSFFVGIVFERDVAVLIVVCVWALSIFTFISNATQIVSVFLVGLVFSFHNLFVSSFRLYDEPKHFALRRFNHSSVFFRECTCSWGVAHRWGYDSVEKPKSICEHAISRSQLLSVLVERCTCSPDSISDFGRLLLLENYHLSQICCTFFSCKYLDHDVFNLNFFSDVRTLVAQDLGFSWTYYKFHFFWTTLESHTAFFGAVLWGSK